jgi:hypothetical protein
MKSGEEKGWGGVEGKGMLATVAAAATKGSSKDNNLLFNIRDHMHNTIYIYNQHQQ